MDRFGGKAIWLRLPLLTDELERRQSFQRLQSHGKVVGSQEGLEVVVQPVSVGIIIAVNGRFLEGSVHPFNLSICPRMIWFSEAVFNAVRPTNVLKQRNDVTILVRS